MHHENTAPPEARPTEHAFTYHATLPTGLTTTMLTHGTINEADIWDTITTRYPGLDHIIEEWDTDGNNITAHASSTYLIDTPLDINTAELTARSYIKDDLPTIHNAGYTLTLDY